MAPSKSSPAGKAGHACRAADFGVHRAPLLAMGTAVLLLLLFGAVSAEARRTGALRKLPVDLVVIHSTGGPTCDKVTGKPIWVGAGTLADNLRQIEAHPVLGIHYMIDRDGVTRSSVPEGQVAHHVHRYSERSIAIELVNDGDGRDPYPQSQLDALQQLLRALAQRHPLGPQSIQRHSDLDRAVLPCDRSQRRKVDPGDAFPFEAVVRNVFGPR